MKKITIIIRPEKLNVVREALNANDIYLMTVTDVKGCGSEEGHTESYRGVEYTNDLLPKVKIEIAVNDHFVQPTIDAVISVARTGNCGSLGDGKIFIEPLEQCIRIRTGETGAIAIGPAQV